ncbi:MAG TPA: twin-arginine translocase subunit TatC [Gemmatimonadales bacterium]|nr:twin-arginine translocase subunit TatC [Gemmatimonadales bacterium]
MSGPGGEMPFLDHLEELRSRLLKSLLAIIGGFAVGLWIVQRLNLIVWLKQPIAPYLQYTGGKLIVTGPTESVVIVLKLSFIVGLVLASPLIIFQAWLFLAPALYTRERRALIPALFAGLILFLIGAALGWTYVVPQALNVFFSFQSDALAYVITYNEYFSFIMQIVLALGISFELPLVIIILAALGLVTPAMLNRFRRFWIVLACIAGALLSPGTDVISMIMMTLPLIVLYEVGYIGSAIIQRRRIRAAATTVLVLAALLFSAGPAGAQQPVPRPDSVARQPRDSLPDSLKARAGQALDTATARRLGLPTAPSRSFAPADSITDLLLIREGYSVTRYRADSATVLPDEQRLVLEGKALAERDGTQLEADSITYRESTCSLDAHGSPNLFDKANVLTGEGIRYDTCKRRGVVTDALTDFKEGSTAWFLRGDIAQDSSASRLYAASSDITSCDLPTPHYYFEAKEVKWTSSHFIVARPAVLYVRDVPILWLPFVFQDTRTGRRSGILVPQFGLNDLVRPTPGYSRQFTNIGYYWAPNDYMDITAKLDWYANRYTTYGFLGSYRWLDRFLNGSFQVSRTVNTGGSRGSTIRWNHQQAFNLNTSLNLTLDYSTNTTQLSNNAIDPSLNTRTISSSLNFSRRERWGTIALGASRRQEITSGIVNMTLPSLNVTPKPIDLSRNVTWSPGVSITNTLNNGLSQPITSFGADTVLTDSTKYNSRNTSVQIATPFRFGGFTWSNSVSVVDQTTGQLTQSNGLPVVDPVTGDTSVVTRLSNGDFSTGIDYQTSIGLPILFRSSWKLQPSVGVSNVTSGPMWLRNARTDGEFVSQTKRFGFTLQSAPTFFGFYPGFGPLGRIRHSLSPIVTYQYNPEAQVPIAYAKAAGLTSTLAPAVQSLSFGLSQNLEGKARPAPGDTTGGQNARKFRLLGIQTTPFIYDFEQAKLPGRTGWQNQTMTNTFQTDLLAGFSLSLQHDLWKGQVGTDSAKFDLFLQNVSANFALTSGTVNGILRLFGLSHKAPPANKPNQPPPPSYIATVGRPSNFFSTDNLSTRNAGKGFTANFSYNLQRTRPVPGQPNSEQQSLGFSTSFNATPFWSLALTSMYNITGNRIESVTIRLQRDLHEWRAGFDFVRNANGNFAFYFSIALTDLPQLKFDYNQTTQKTE